jgi:Mg2+-importing ATPase
LLISTCALVVIAPAITYLPFAGELGFVPLPATLLAVIVGITLCYVLAAELMKRWFYRAPRHGGYSGARGHRGAYRPAS